MPRKRRINKKTDKQRDLLAVGHRRILWLGVLGLLAWAGMTVRLVQVQGIERDAYGHKAKKQHERLQQLKASRGALLDCRGHALAMDMAATTFWADPGELKQLEAVAHHFAPYSRHGYKALLQELRSGENFVHLARQIHSEGLGQLRDHNFSGVYEYPEARRFYPYGQAAGQVLGFTNVDNKGGSGIELAREKQLGESKGLGLAKVDAFGRRVPGGLQERQTPRNGSSLVLTLDIAYQGILEEELARAIDQSEAESGLGIIADPNTGEILAMANLPLYDPNDPARAPARLHRNRTITDPFEPGSTFKAITAAAILERGIVEPEDSIFCENGQLDLGYGASLRDLESYGQLTFREIIEKSSNIGIAKAAQGLKRRDFYAWIRNFGFGSRTGIDLPGESGGQLGHVNKWSARSLETIAIGQEISVTALQLVQAFGAIANGGMLMAPKLVREVRGPDGQVARRESDQSIRRVISEETAAKVRKMLAGAVREGTGAKAQIEAVEVAGKTGTAQRVSAKGGGYAVGETTVSFIGFLPAQAPQLLCLIVVDNPGKDKWGGHIAAPAFKRTVERILQLPGRFELDEKKPRVALRVAPGLVPDFRGMGLEKARQQAELRHFRPTFLGAGEVVIRQWPEPGKHSAETRVVRCEMGYPEDIGRIALRGAPRRQAILVDKVREVDLAVYP